MTSASVDEVEAVHSQSLEDLVKQHFHILEEHLNLWKSVQAQLHSDSEYRIVAQKCTLHTQQMLHNFDQLSAFLDNSNVERLAEGVKHTSLGLNHKHPKSTPPPTHNSAETSSMRSSKKRRIHSSHEENTATTTSPIKDHSNLFSIDTNPTPVEQLLSQMNEQVETLNPSKRRKQSRSNSSTRSTSSNGLAQDADQISANEKPHHRPDDISTINTSTIADPVQPTQVEEDDAFLAKFSKRYREKEEQRKKKANKKRKRDSNTSVESRSYSSLPEHKKKKNRKMDGNDVVASEHSHSSEKLNKVGQKRAGSANGQDGKRQRLG